MMKIKAGDIAYHLNEYVEDDHKFLVVKDSEGATIALWPVIHLVIVCMTIEYRIDHLNQPDKAPSDQVVGDGVAAAAFWPVTGYSVYSLSDDLAAGALTVALSCITRAKKRFFHAQGATLEPTVKRAQSVLEKLTQHNDRWGLDDHQQCLDDWSRLACLLEGNDRQSSAAQQRVRSLHQMGARLTNHIADQPGTCSPHTVVL